MPIFTHIDDALVDSKKNLQPGVYSCYVENAIDKISKNGNEMTEISIKLFDNYGSEHKIFDWILYTENTRWKLKSACIAMGLKEKYDSCELYAHDYIGKCFKIKVDYKKNDKNENVIRVIEYIKNESQSLEFISKEFNDEIPF